LGLIDRKDDGKSRSLVRVWEGGRTMASIGCSSFTMVCVYVCMRVWEGEFDRIESIPIHE